MHPIVRERFVSLIAPFEGRCSWMYLCQKQYVTTAIGLLIDPMPLAFHLDWRKEDETPASHSEIAKEWHAVKAKKEWSEKGGGYYRRMTTLHITDEEIDRATSEKLDSMWTHLLRWLPDLESWPADGQMGLLSMAWGLGPRIDLRMKNGRREWPKFTAAAKAADFVTCAAECEIRNSPKRSATNRQMFENAARVVAEGLCPSQLVA